MHSTSYGLFAICLRNCSTNENDSTSPRSYDFCSLTIITGVIYPLAVTGIAQVDISASSQRQPHHGRWQSCRLGIDRSAVRDPRYFWGRISATGAFAYNAYNAENLTASSGSNYGPLNPALMDMVQARIDALKAADPDNTLPIPVDLVTASGSGLDPHISVAAALYQVRRVASARGLDEADVKSLGGEIY